MIDVLDERKRMILSAIIEEFTCMAEPVGSKHLVEKYGLNFSSATVRNELAVLEEMGYLRQPHTSAGRVPTDKGYRFYVDTLTEPKAFALVELAEIRRFYADLDHEIERMMKETTNLLARLTNCLALVYAPDIRKERIKHVDLVGLGGKGLMIVVITNIGSLSKQVIELAEPLRHEALAEMEKTLNEALANQPVSEVAKVSLENSALAPAERRMLEVVYQCIRDALAENDARVYFDGTSCLLTQPEFDSLNRVREALYLIEENYRILEWLRGVADDCRPTVSIGAENQLELAGYSLVASGYEIGGESVGALAILGPTRMDYRRTISAVQLIAENLGRALAELQG